VVTLTDLITTTLVPENTPTLQTIPMITVPILGTPPGENDLALTLDANPGASAGPIAPSPGPEGEGTTIVGPPSPEVDWQKPITEYLQLGTIPDDETET
jgi:hypothetical protein